MEQHPTLLRLADVKSRTGLGKTKIYELIGEGDFPMPVKIGPLSLWVEAEVEGWITAIIESRDSAAA